MDKTGNQLIVVTGPTASGKTSLAIDLARAIETEIVSADSRQIFTEIPIGTAAPTAEERAAVPHHFIATLGLDQYYSAATYEEDVMRLLPQIFDRCGGRAVMAGGSMMYVDAVCNGIDLLPTVSDENRRRAYGLYEREGLVGVIEALRGVDPDYLAKTSDLKNHKRLIHALEVSLEAGRPYSSLLTGNRKDRLFEIIKFAIDYPREELFDRINRRVDMMIGQGMIDEAREVYPRRHLNSLNTVGYKELFAYFDGVWDLDTAIARIKKNTRVYAKKQLTWLRRDQSVVWLDPHRSMLPEILNRLNPTAHTCDL
ncbi:MAG: tRNA (adenosine(37)-N6)-dimethylallyltransferase MiaA [Muribaculaceae bacterium]|nr:tRNA (adenosine(37)-N6)-dimethylallyltransferase MiaA [Muribaculaceae bacterium]